MVKRPGFRERKFPELAGDFGEDHRPVSLDEMRNVRTKTTPDAVQKLPPDSLEKISLRQTVSLPLAYSNAPDQVTGELIVSPDTVRE